MTSVRLENGRTLVTLHQPDGRVVEVDAKGQVRWSLDNLRMPMTAQRLDDGTTLVAEYQANRVAAWSRNGAVVWQAAGVQQPYSAQRLLSGNTLIAHRAGVREVDRQNNIIWRKSLHGVRHAVRY